MKGDPCARVPDGRDSMVLKAGILTPWTGMKSAVQYRQQGIIQQRAKSNNINRFLQAFADNTQHKQAGTEI